MFQFIESIAVDHNTIPLIEWHQQRINGTFSNWYLEKKPFDLKTLLSDYHKQVLHKLRFLYNDAHFQIEIAPYQPKKIKQLQIVESREIDYSFKYSDRSQLKVLFDQRGLADDIIIAVNGHPTDSYYANICYFDGTSWFTSNSHLLNGVMRQKLIAEGKVKERAITVSDLSLFEKVSLVNALNPLGRIEISTKAINP